MPGAEVKTDRAAVDPSIADITTASELKSALSTDPRLNRSDRAKILGVLNDISLNRQVSDAVIDGLPKPIDGLNKKIKDLRNARSSGQRQ